MTNLSLAQLGVSLQLNGPEIDKAFCVAEPMEQFVRTRPGALRRTVRLHLPACTTTGRPASSSVRRGNSKRSKASDAHDYSRSVAPQVPRGWRGSLRSRITPPSDRGPQKVPFATQLFTDATVTSSSGDGNPILPSANSKWHHAMAAAVDGTTDSFCQAPACRFLSLAV